MFEKIKEHMTAEPATLFGLGNVKYAPGTMGSLVTLPIVYLLAFLLGDKAVFVFTVTVFTLGLWVSKRYLAKNPTSTADPQEVIIDEVAGQGLALFLLPPSLTLYALSFVLFRFFDIVKPWPVSWCDQKLPGAKGVMLDDVTAGLYALLCMIGLQYAGLG